VRARFSLRPPAAAGSVRGDAERGRLVARIDSFLADPPAGYYPPEKLTDTLERVRAQDVEGVVVFSTSGLTSTKLWDAIGAFFAK
jgi:hypothetical protein